MSPDDVQAGGALAVVGGGVVSWFGLWPHHTGTESEAERWRPFSILSLLVEHKGRPMSYIMHIAVTTEPPMLAGREIWGFPKKLAQIEFKSEKDMVYGTLERPAGVRLASAIVRPERPATNGHSSAPPAVSFRLIPSAEENGRPVCADIIETHTEVKVHEAWTGTGSIAFAEGSRLDPWNRLPVKRVIQASYVLSEMTLGFGKVIDRLE